MRITSIFPHPIHQIPSLAAAPGRNRVVEVILPILLAEVDALPDGLDALIATSALQGIDPKDGYLLGHRVAIELEILADMEKIPSPKTTGIVLAGDLYAQTDKRGGYGDVREVWQGFSRRFRWVAGVAGNHDRFGDSIPDIKGFKVGRGIHYLDGDMVEVDGIRIGGISGIIGKPSKPFRRSEKDFRRTLRQLFKELPDILILHESPNDPDNRQMGNESIRSELATASKLLVICGHSHWKVPICDLYNTVQVLNVDSQVVVLKVAEPT
jgi:Icc protein